MTRGGLAALLLARAALLGASGFVSAGLAQVRVSAIDQISTTARAPLPQVASPSPAGPTVIGAAQLGAPDRGGAQPAQLAPSIPSAQAPQPLSSPAEGRTAVVERIAGSDRCDPAVAPRAKPRCAALLENRAADFARAAPELSPEQKIFADQQARDSSLETATRALGNKAPDTRSIEAQGIANLVLQSNTPPPKPAVPDKDAIAVDQAAALVNALILQGPATPTPHP